MDNKCIFFLLHETFDTQILVQLFPSYKCIVVFEGGTLRWTGIPQPVDTVSAADIVLCKRIWKIIYLNIVLASSLRRAGMRIHSRVTRIHSRVTRIQSRVTRIQSRATRIQSRATRIQSRVTRIQSRMTRIQSRVTKTYEICLQ
jgi:uncharacterized protein YukE